MGQTGRLAPNPATITMRQERQSITIATPLGTNRGKRAPINTDDHLGSDLLIILPLLSWLFMILQAFQLAMEGQALAYGPMMGLFDWAVGKMSEHGQMMLVAMMVPTMAICKYRKGLFVAQSPRVAFITGYLLPWTLIAVLATWLQFYLQTQQILNEGMMLEGPFLSGSILLLIACYYVVPFSQNKLAFIKPLSRKIAHSITNDNDFNHGLESGLYCIQRNGPIMASMLVFGLMNVVYMIALTILMIIEKRSQHKPQYRYLLTATLTAIGLSGVGSG